jgi:hypothetical protein
MTFRKASYTRTHTHTHMRVCVCGWVGVCVCVCVHDCTAWSMTCNFEFCFKNWKKFGIFQPNLHLHLQISNNDRNGRHDYKHDDIQRNDIQLNDTQHVNKLTALHCCVLLGLVLFTLRGPIV